MPSPPLAEPPTSVPALVRDGGRGLAALLVVVALVKLIVLADHEANDPLADHLTSDQAYYVERAQGLAGAIDDPRADEPYHLPPLYPAFLSLHPGIEQRDGTAPRVTQVLAGIAALAGIYAFARRRTERLGALVATGLVAAYGPITFFELKLLGDTLAYDLLVALLVAADAWHARPAPWRAGLAGALTGATALLRPQALLLGVLLAPWFLRRDRRSGAAFLVAFALLLVPSAAHNMATSGDLILVSDNGGVNLWLANGEDAPLSGTFATDDPNFGDIATQADAARTRAERDVGEPLSAGEVSAYFRGRALDAIVDAPETFVRRLGLRSAALVESFQTGIVAVPQTEREAVAPLAVLALPFGVLLALAAAACLLLGPRPWVLRPPEGPRPSWVPTLAVLAMVVVTTLAFFHYERFRLIAVPPAATLVGMAVDRIVRRRGAHPARAGGALLVAGLVVWISSLDAPHHAPTLANGYTSLGDAVLADAAAAGMAGDPARAVALAERAQDYVERALEHQPGFVRALLLGVRASLSAGDVDDARRFLDRLDEVAPGLPDAQALRGFIEG